MDTTKHFTNSKLLFGMLLWMISNVGRTQDLVNGNLPPFPTKESALRRVIPYPNAREADVMWARRIWRFMDIRQKINFPFYEPLAPTDDRWCLFDIIRFGLLNDWITAYGLGPTQDDDEFRFALSDSQVVALINPTRLRYVESLDTGEREAITSMEPISA
jgi:hypothetical protein